MAVFPVILIREEAFRHNPVLLRHERIHLRQQAELLIVPFYLLYLAHYLLLLLRFRNHTKAYLNIVFEREAYQMEHVPDYLRKRRLWAWRQFF
jgi:hypothetical protein